MDIDINNRGSSVPSGHSSDRYSCVKIIQYERSWIRSPLVCVNVVCGCEFLKKNNRGSSIYSILFS